MRVTSPHIFQPVFNQANRTAKFARDITNQNRMFDAAFHAIAAANINIIMHPNGIAWQVKAAGNLISIFWHLD